VPLGSAGSVLNGNSSSTFDGALYFPTTQLTYNGNSSANGYTIVVADKLLVNGNSQMGNDYSSWPTDHPSKVRLCRNENFRSSPENPGYAAQVTHRTSRAERGRASAQRSPAHRIAAGRGRVRADFLHSDLRDRRSARRRAVWRPEHHDRGRHQRHAAGRSR
jgi:hypothetical protein